MSFFLILIDNNGFEKQFIHDSLPGIYKVPVTRKLVTYDWTGSTTLEKMLSNEGGMRDCGYEIKDTIFELTHIRDRYGRHVYREINN
jgi:hypothetical protein